MRLTPLLALAGTTLANPAHLANRQAPNLPAYTSAASALIASYIPPSAFSVLSASASSAAAAASVTGDISSLIYSALENPTPPAWFSSAIPSEYSSAISGLTAAIASLAPTGTGTGAVAQTSTGSGPSQTIPTVVDTVVVVTSTNSAGSVVTKSVTSAVIVTGTEAAATGVGSSVTRSGTGTRTSTAVTTSTSSSSTNAAAAAAAAARPTCALAGLAVLAGLIAAV